MVKQIIKEAMDQNPLGLKEAVEAELQNRVTLALEAKMQKMKEEDDDEDDEEEDDEEDEDEDDDEDDEDLEEVNIMRKKSPAQMAKTQKARLAAAVTKSAAKTSKSGK
jgi:hypothetical protein